jgi:putative spermidine/putrescine transport system ATP-binding protein
VVRPPVLLCDEPLAALDRKLRQSMQVELKQLQKELGVTLIFVTHDQEEAMTMSDRIAVMNAGRIEQFGTPTEIYSRPRTRFVADFIGEINLFECTWRDGSFRLDEGVVLPTDDHRPSGAGTVAVRPERMRFAPADQALLSGRVESTSFVGGQTIYRIVTEAGRRLLVKEISAGASSHPVGGVVGIRWNPQDAVVLED